MPKDRTPEEDVPVTKRVSRMFGGRGSDIELPNTGKRDPRLPARPGDVGREVLSGFKAVRKLTRANKRSNGR